MKKTIFLSTIGFLFAVIFILVSQASNKIPFVDPAATPPYVMRLADMPADGQMGPCPVLISGSFFSGPAGSIPVLNINLVDSGTYSFSGTFPKGDTGATGSNATTTSVATTVSNGLMSASDKMKLDSISSILTFSSTQSMPLIALGGLYTFNVAVPGAATNGVVVVNATDNALLDALSSGFNSYVVSSGTVTVRLKVGIALAAGTRVFTGKVIP